MKQLLNWVGGMERLLHGVGWRGAVKLGFPRSLGGSQPLDGFFAGFRCRAVFVIIILEFTKYEIESVNYFRGTCFCGASVLDTTCACLFVLQGGIV